MDRNWYNCELEDSYNWDAVPASASERMSEMADIIATSDCSAEMADEAEALLSLANTVVADDHVDCDLRRQAEKYVLLAQHMLNS